MPIAGGNRIPFHTMRGTIGFKDVSFSYPTRPSQVILRNLNLTVPAGHVVALCGPSGSGKFKLILWVKAV